MPGQFGTSDGDDGVFASTNASSHVGVFGSNKATAAPSGGGAGGAGVFGLSVSPGAAGVFGANNSTQGVGVQGNGPDAGVSGFSDRGAGVRSHSNQGNAVEGFAHDPNGSAILAINDAKTAPTLNDGSPHGCGVLGVTTVPGSAGLFGANNSAQGVGVQGNGPEAGVSGFSTNGNGVVGFSRQGDAIQGNAGIGGNAIHGRGGTFAGLFEGGVRIQGGSLEVLKSGDIGGEISAQNIVAHSKSFRIDHPLDPIRKYLIHATVESSEMLNLYSGVMVLDENGEAEVALPEWFEALNRDFRYQLTCLGSFAPVYVARKIADNRFKIAGGHPGLEVSWQVAGTRHDRWAREHPFAAVVEKPREEARTGDIHDYFAEPAAAADGAI